MKNVIITMGTGLLCLLLGPDCTWLQRIMILIVAAGSTWCLVEGLSELIERARWIRELDRKIQEIREKEEPEELRRRNYFNQLLLTATLPQKVSTLKVRTLTGKRPA